MKREYSEEEIKLREEKRMAFRAGFVSALAVFGIVCATLLIALLL